MSLYAREHLQVQHAKNSSEHMARLLEADREVQLDFFLKEVLHFDQSLLDIDELYGLDIVTKAEMSKLLEKE